MKILRTPDDRFENLPGYPYAPRYTEVPDGEGETLRIHHVDEGPRGAATVLCMHGQPSWSYLYRHMIAALGDRGLRVVAPDLVGYGRSDKPSRREDYSYQRQVDWMTAWLVQNDLRDLTLVGQDWGGLTGLRMVAENAERLSRIVIANTGSRFRRKRSPVIAGNLDGRKLTAEEVAAYDAPFEDPSYKMGCRAMPRQVPTLPGDPS
ncbi:MAG: haloalkane dehalogenase, partial [Myxococcota bacterium]